MSPRLERLIALYKKTLLIGVNFLLLIVAFWLCLNLGLAAVFYVWDHQLKRHNPIVQKYGGAVQKAYPDWSSEELDLLLRESWNRPLEADFVALMRESAYQGKYVNVDPHGFRVSAHPGPWPPDRRHLNIFFFGGSTSFGYGVKDDETVASALAKTLHASGSSAKPIAMYNFGRAGYYSTTERMVFERLLQEGHVPDVAVFMDGLNEFENAQDTNPAFLRSLDNWAYHPGSALWMDIVRLLYSPPLVRLQHSLKTGFLGYQLRGKKPAPAAVRFTSDQNQAMIERYRSNHRLISVLCAGYHIRPLFVWQPIPFFKYDIRNSVMTQLNPSREALFGYGQAVNSLRGRLGPNFLWLADMQEALGTQTLYVDSVHYSAFMSKKIAEQISQALIQRK